MKANQPLTLEAVELSFADPWTPRERVVVGGLPRHGDREERRTLETSTEVVPSLSQAERLDPEDGEAGTIRVVRAGPSLPHSPRSRAGQWRAGRRLSGGVELCADQSAA